MYARVRKTIMLTAIYYQTIQREEYNKNKPRFLIVKEKKNINNIKLKAKIKEGMDSTSRALCIEFTDSNSTKPKQFFSCWKKEFHANA